MSINVIIEPKVFLVGQSQVNESELSRFLESEDVAGWTTDTSVGGERLVECAGRCCYMSFAKPRPGGNAAYIGHILEVGHGSVLEHATFNMIFAGVSRSLTHELVRHRAGMSYSQLSQRYVDESDVAFEVPPALIPHKAEWEAHVERWTKFQEDSRNYYMNPTSHGLNYVPVAPEPSRRAIMFNAWKLAVDRCLDSYKEISDGLMLDFADIADKTERRKSAREAARSVLPNATETKIFVTGNGRSWRHFVEQRGSRHADAEIRRLALAVLNVLQTASPNLFGDYRLIGLPDGGKAIETDHPKV